MAQELKPERIPERRQMIREMAQTRDFRAELDALAGAEASPMQLTRLHQALMTYQGIPKEDYPMSPYASEQDADRERRNLHRVMDISAARKRRAFRRSMQMLAACLGFGIGCYLLLIGAAWDLPVVQMGGGAVAVASVIAGITTLFRKEAGLRG